MIIKNLRLAVRTSSVTVCMRTMGSANMAKKLPAKFNNTNFQKKRQRTFGLLKAGKNPNAASPKMAQAIKKQAMSFPTPGQQRSGEKKGYYMP